MILKRDEQPDDKGLDAATCSRSSECPGPTHYAGCSCHEKGWQNKWESAVEMAARATVERDEWREKAEKLAVTCYTWEDNWKLAVQDNSTRKENNFALHRRNMRLNAELTAAKCTLAKWIEWARMHGHIDHAAGIADDSRRLISSENAGGMARGLAAQDSESPNRDNG